VFVALTFARQGALAQGTLQFVWHGNSNFFNASFQVTDAEMQAGALFGSSMFYNSLSVTSLSGVAYQYGGGGLALGQGNPFAISIDLLNFTTSTEVHLGAGGDFHGVIQEKPFSGPDIYNEAGYWTYSAIPEPSAGALTSLGVSALVLRKLKT
jgi:hypothetical protein